MLLISIISISITASTAVIFATLGGILTEKSGVINLTIEGILKISAMAGFAGAYYSHSALIGILVASVAGGIASAVYSYLANYLKLNQVVTGLAIFISFAALAELLGQKIGPGGKALVGLTGPTISWKIFSKDVLTYVAFLLAIIMAYIFKYTPTGLRLRAVGEDAKAAHANGIDVVKFRNYSTIIGGMIIGLGGAHLSLAYTPGWSDNITAGRGWIAVAMIILSRWKPLYAIPSCLLFGAATAVQFRIQSAGIDISLYLLNMLPYLLTVLVVTLAQVYKPKGNNTPGNLGVPFSAN